MRLLASVCSFSLDIRMLCLSVPLILLFSQIRYGFSLSSPKSLISFKEKETNFACPCSKLRYCQPAPESFVCQRLYGNGSVFADPRTSDIRETALETLDLTNFTVVVDMRCTYNFRHAYYHGIADCLVPMTTVLLSQNLTRPGTAWIIEEYHRRILEEFDMLPPVAIIDAPRNKAIPIIANGIWAPVFGEKMPDCARCFRRYVQHVLNLSTTGTCFNRTTLYVRRDPQRGRELIGDVELLNMLSDAFPTLPVVYFWGNESMRTTVEMFADAKLIVAPHGAGMVNCLFCRDDALLIEVTRSVLSSNQIWRSNTPILEAAGIQTHKVVIQLNEIYTRLAGSNTTLLHYLQSESDDDVREAGRKNLPLPLSISDMANIVVASSKHFVAECWGTDRRVDAAVGA